jgi:hypothetical protein
MSTATLLAKTPAARNGKYKCEKCDHAPFTTPQGLHMHIGRVHTGKIKAYREKGTRRLSVAKYNGFHVRGVEPVSVVPPIRRGPGRPRKIATPQDLAEAILERRAGPEQHLSCPTCSYDLMVLVGSKVPNKVCPGCATTFQSMIDKLSAVMR